MNSSLLDIDTTVCHNLDIGCFGKESLMTFDKFMLNVEQAILDKVGMSHDDFADASWYDLYEDTDQGKECTNEMVYETLADADGIFQQMLELV